MSATAGTRNLIRDLLDFGSGAADCVALLSHANAHVRRDAARDLYVAGVALCEAAIDEWRTDREFDELLVRASHEHSPWRMVVGIAVKPETFAAIHKVMGAPRLADVPPDQDAKEFEIHCDDGAELDILTARGAGLAVWAIPTGSDPLQKLIDAKPDRLLTSFSELKALA